VSKNPKLVEAADLLREAAQNIYGLGDDYARQNGERMKSFEERVPAEDRHVGTTLRSMAAAVSGLEGVLRWGWPE
jgi:hypothetical protein